jgi:hypothetical protein
MFGSRSWKTRQQPCAGRSGQCEERSTICHAALFRTRAEITSLRTELNNVSFGVETIAHGESLKRPLRVH